jgi:hypothetical protein
MWLSTSQHIVPKMHHSITRMVYILVLGHDVVRDDFQALSSQSLFVLVDRGPFFS